MEVDGDAVGDGLLVVVAGEVVVTGGFVVACFVGATVVVSDGVGVADGEWLTFAGA